MKKLGKALNLSKLDVDGANIDNYPDEEGPDVGGAAQYYNASAPVEYDFGIVTEITDTHIRVKIQRSHHDLAGESLVFYVKVDNFQDA